MRGKIMSAYFEFNFEELDNNELRINGKSSYTDEWDTIIIKKEWIAIILQNDKRVYNKTLKGDAAEEKNDAGGIAVGQRGGGCFRNRF